MRSVAVIGLPDEDRGQRRPRHRRGRPGRRRRRPSCSPSPASASPGTSCPARVEFVDDAATRRQRQDAPVALHARSDRSVVRSDRSGVLTPERWRAATVRAMHDDRELVEERIRRELTERVLPLVHPGARAARRRGRAVARRAGAVRRRRPLGAAVGDDVVPVHRRGAGAVVGPARRGARSTSASGSTRPASSARASFATARGDRSRASTRAARRCRSATSPGPSSWSSKRRPTRLLPQFRPSPLGSPATAGDRLLYRLDRAELVLVDPDAEALLHDLDVLDGVMRALALDRPAPGPPPARASCGPSTWSPAAGGATTARAARAVLGPALAAPAPGEHPPGRRHRPRPHRHRLAVAAAGDGAQVHPHVRLGGRADGRRPRLPLLRARRRSSTRGSPSASPSCSPASPRRSPPASGSRSAGCGSSPT